MSLDDLLKKAKDATAKAHAEVKVPVPAEEVQVTTQPIKRKLRYLVEIGGETFTPQEIAALLPELQEFSEPTFRLLESDMALPIEIIIELSKHFQDKYEMDEWLETPNDEFEGKTPLQISHSRLLKTLRGVYDES